ncbi:prepilin-type N-terminal cleavage/methylation domain-containing protein [Halomonas caseinilytica]|uniref:prepilin-type N-terminal cleavage/methylation domain-containing protein n=1 Tax=Halomonas caseinilytica TaxID=438744 RepID=UPI000A4BF68E|nr:GspH/FimT family pseudopilin [Halomonas caseinilytica]
MSPVAMHQRPSRHCQAGDQSGFSLLEVLIVMTIIAALTGLSVAWLEGGSEPSLDSARERLRIDLERAAIQAMEQQRAIGLRPSDTGYAFVTREPGDTTWQRLETPSLPPRRWQLDIALRRHPVSPASPATPWLIWWPDGEVLGGRLELSTDERHRHLVIDLLGIRDATAGETTHATERDNG